jgi:hypothetical protein
MPFFHGCEKLLKREGVQRDERMGKMMMLGESFIRRRDEIGRMLSQSHVTIKVA